MKILKIRIFALALIGLLGAGVPARGQDGNEILKKVDANLQPESFESYRKLINIEPSGAKREFLLYTIKKGNDKIVSLFLSPASEKGRATLLDLGIPCEELDQTKGGNFLHQEMVDGTI